MSTGSLQIREKLTGADGATIYLKGYLDLSNCDELLTRFEQLFELGRINVSVNMSGLEYLASAGIGVLIEAFSIAEEKGGSLTFTKLSPKAREIFKLLGIMLNACEPE